MKCNIVVNIAYVKITIVNKSDWVSVSSYKYADMNSTASIPLEYIGGADYTCVHASTGTITGNVLSIPVTTNNVTVTLTNAKCLVSVTNNDTEAISAITPSSQFVPLGNTATFNVTFNSGFVGGNSNVSVGTFSGSTLSIPTSYDSVRINSVITPYTHTVTITNNVPYIVPEYSTCQVRHNQNLICNIVYGESSDYTCISATSGTLTPNGIVINSVTSDVSSTINLKKVQVKVTNDAPYHVIEISPEIQYVTPGQTAQATLTYLTGYDPSDLNTTLGTLTNNTLSVPTSSSQSTTDDYFVTANLYRETNVLIELGTDSSSTSSTSPVSTYYNYSVTQQLYKSSELGSSDTINSIAFYLTTDGKDTRNIDIYMENVTDTTLSTFKSISNATKVFSGLFNVDGIGWHTITLDTPFEYNSSRNLLITVNDKTGSYSVKRYFRVYLISGQSGIAREMHNDSSAYDVSNMPSISSHSLDSKPSIRIQKGHVIHDEPDPEPVIEPTIIEIGVTSGSAAIKQASIPFYATQKYSMTEQLYLPSEINQSGTITEIGFMYSETTAADRMCDIYLLHTETNKFTTKTSSTDATLDYICPSANDLVFSGTVHFTKGWTTIHLDTPFVYDGVHNLCVIVYDKTGLTASSGCQFIANETSATERKTWKKYGSSALDPTSAASLTSGTNFASYYRNVIQIGMV